MKRSVFLTRALSAALITLSVTACSGNESSEALLGKAQESLRAADPASAEIHLKNLLQKDEDNAEARFLLGQLYRQANNLVAAEHELQRAVDLGFDPARARPELLETMLVLGRDAESIAAAGKDSTGDPLADARIRTAVGQARLQQRDLDQARTAFEAALAARPDYVPAQVGLTRLQAFGDRQAARSGVDQILAKNPDSAEALLLLADLQIADRQLAAARETLTKFIQQRPNDVVNRAKLVSVSLDLNDLEQATKDLASLRRLAPKAPATHYLAASVLSRQNQLEKAREEAEEALRLAPGYLPALSLAAGLSLNANALEQAERYSKQLIERLPQNPIGYRVLGATQLRHNEAQKALDTVRAGLEHLPQDAPLLALAGEASLKLNQNREATGYFQRASELAPDNARTRTGLALSHIAAGDTDTGIEELEQATELDAGNLQADVALVATLLRNREFDKALAAIERMEKKAPATSALPMNLRGTILAAKGDLPGARAAFDKALEIDPTFLAAASNLATLDLREGHPGDARQRYETLLARDPKNAGAAVALAVLTARTGGTPDEVLPLLKRAREADPDAVLPILASARYLMQTNAPRDAIPMLQEAANRNPNDVRILDQLAQAFRQSGQPTQAIASWEKALRIDPKLGLAQFRIGETQLGQGDRTAALASFRKAAALSPEAVEPRAAMASLLQQDGRKDEAMAIAAELRGDEKTKVAGLILQGDLNAANGKLPAAIDDFQQAYAVQRSLPVGTRLHRALLAALRETDADRMLHDWIRSEPENLALRMFAGESQTARRHWKQAFEQYAVVLEKQPDNVVALNNAAWALHELKDERALDYGRRAYEAAPKAANVIDTYGTILVARGDRKGVELMREAVSVAPANPQLRLHLAQALMRFDDPAGARAELQTLLQATPEGPAAEEAKGLLEKIGG